MKLKALTVSGFKSFAEKTSFDFDDGVTCVVGPNGCGKSNVVDAMKWVLGEQSAKSLRGGEMMDVIFNGTPQRRSSAFAEVSLTFEDVAGILGEALGGKDAAAPADRLITITRRLYRSGESGYFINKQPARLKDFREMFMDTGVGANAYSVIEQGKVETFLQANPNDRRALFDEAAGISRYKARKKEALRRLERVDQNLLRLTDILGEVSKRLRSIKYQAGKARNYQVYSTSLKELRSLFSLAEYHRLSAQRRALQQDADRLGDAMAAVSAQIDRLEASRTANEAESAELDKRARALDAQLAEVATQTVASEQRSEMLAARAAELADAIAAGTGRGDQLEARAETNTREIDSHRQVLAGLTAELEALTVGEKSLRADHAAANETVHRLRRGLEEVKTAVIDLMGRIARLNNEASTHAVRREGLQAHRQRLLARSEEVARQEQALLDRRTSTAATLEDVTALLADTAARLDQAKTGSDELGRQSQQVAAEISEAQQRHSALQSRRHALEEMQQRREGVGAGVRRVLAAARDGRFAWVCGMLGELISTDVAHAGVIEAALAGAEQRLLADRAADVAAAAGDLRGLLADADGVEFVCRDQQDAGEPAESPLPPEGVIAVAADWVRCEPEMAGLVRSLLGRTLVVESLDAALAIRGLHGRSWRLVTLTGEVVEGDGRIRLGAARSTSGVISRRSELDELARQLEASAAHVEQLKSRRDEIAVRQCHIADVMKTLRRMADDASAQRVEGQSVIGRLDEQLAELRKEAPLLAEEVRQLADEIVAAEAAEATARAAAGQLEAERADREAGVARLNEQLAAASAHAERVAADLTRSQVALAEVRQKRDGLEANLRRLAQAGEAMARELEELRRQVEVDRNRRAEALAEAAAARERIGVLVGERTRLTAEADENAESRRGLEQRTGEIRNQLHNDRKHHDELSGQVNALRVQLGEAEVRIENLLARTREEIGMDVAAAYPAYTHDEHRDWEAVRAEIDDLRGKIERLGNVNLDAIAEQDELAQRETFLTTQIDDIRASQHQLNELIRRLNVESKTRFEQSFAAVRSHFNELFRKLFGGGKADILLTNPEDELESGIDIVARPPGKELRSISLLSGGEKTMTALALMFSFFKSRPSPFCLLDEVDAALDEANTQRFTQLVREFLGTCQFVIISHAKRTIGMADQIYGVTMQEPGVSTRISVRFEDATKMTEDASPQAVEA